MDSQRRDDTHNRLSLISGQFLLLATFILNLLTTFGAIWTIFKLGIEDSNHRGSLLSVEDNEQLGQILALHGDISVDRLMVKDRLVTDAIENQLITIIGKDDTKDPQVGISLNPDYVSMRAKSYGSGRTSNHGYIFRLDRKLKTLELAGKTRNVRSIRSHFSHSPDNENNTNLHISSIDRFELSGNSGISIHSEHISLVSSDFIDIESKQDAIELRSSTSDGFSIPNLQIHNQNQVESMQYLCWRKADGLIYESNVSCR